MGETWKHEAETSLSPNGYGVMVEHVKESHSPPRIRLEHAAEGYACLQLTHLD